MSAVYDHESQIARKLEDRLQRKRAEIDCSLLGSDCADMRKAAIKLFVEVARNKLEKAKVPGLDEVLERMRRQALVEIGVGDVQVHSCTPPHELHVRISRAELLRRMAGVP